MQRLLVFSKTTGYRHDESIDEGNDLIRELAAADNIEVDRSEDASDFSLDNLSRYSAVVWLQVSGNVLEPVQRQAFSRFISDGGGFAGIHGTSDAERSWPEFSKILGARFLHHPGDQSQSAQISIETQSHPSTLGLPDPWLWVDEWYAFDRNPREGRTVLLTVDEGSYDPEEPRMGTDHPLSWCHSFGSGKVWYTALGHHPESYSWPVFRSHIWGGIRSVLR